MTWLAVRRRTAAEVAEQLDDASTELLELYPRLTDALERDTGQNTDAKVAGSRPPAQPVNELVLDAMTTLTRDIPDADYGARSRLADPNHTSDLTTCLAAVVALYKRLEAVDPAHARRYANHVFGWQRLARKAIGLTRPATPLGHTCPLHHQPVSPLLIAGDEGELTNTHPGTREAIMWRRGQTVFCPDCKAQWGPAEWPFLGRLLAEALVNPEDQP